MKTKIKIGVVALLCLSMIFLGGSCSNKENKQIEKKEVFVVAESAYGLYGFATPDKKGLNTKYTEYVYQRAMPFSEGMAAVKIGEKWGFVNKKLDLVIPSKYKNVYSFSEGLARVSEDGKLWGFVNKEGKLIIPAVYKHAQSFKNGLAAVQKDGSWGMINQKGEVVVPFDYSSISNWSTDNMIEVESQGKRGLLDGKTGNLITPLEYDGISLFHENLSCVKKGRFHGYIDKKGETVIPLVYDETNKFSEGYGAVKKDGLWGFIGKDGLAKIPFEYENVGSFSEGLAAVQKDGKVGYIDKSGNVVIPFSFTDAGNFRDGIAEACKNGKWGIINKSGKAIIDFIFKKIIHYEEEGLIIADNGDLTDKTVFNLDGEVLSEFVGIAGLSCPDSSNVRYDIGIETDWEEFDKIIYGK